MHLHSQQPPATVTTTKLARVLSLTVLAVIAVATVIGLVALWPDHDRVAQLTAGPAAQNTSQAEVVNAEVLSITDGCEELFSFGDPASPEAAVSGSPQNPEASLPDTPRPEIPRPESCKTASVGLLDGPRAGHVENAEMRDTFAVSGIRVGDTVQVVGQEITVPGDSATSPKTTTFYSVAGVSRGVPLAILALVFVAVLLWIGKVRGFLSLIALGISLVVVFGWMLPGLISGGPGIAIGLVGSVAIMLVTLYFVHGFNHRTTSALIGTLAGIAIISVVSWISISATRLSGVSDGHTASLAVMTHEIDFRGMLTAAVLIAGLGILNDVTISQASSVWELRAAAPQMSRNDVYLSAMRIGRDHIASTVYTVFFAYVGAAVSTLILLYLMDRPLLTVLSTEDIALEIVRTLVGSIGLILAVPITTWIASRFIAPGTEE